ncbi:MAG TPA: serine/threonine-protein kinase [Vicinamibacterales bacterium]|nr:serine/threonine-protein kinase [Vicinamibacterales bacterium]
MTRAFADRASIDWNALLARVRDPAGRAALESLRRLDALRGVPAASAVPAAPGAATGLLRLLVAVAALQTLAALMVAAALVVTTRSFDPVWPQVFVVAAFASAALLLASASARDRRVLLLLATFTFAASAFARAIVSAHGSGPLAASGLFRGLFPETFVPAALWQFAILFPGVQRFTRFDVWSRRIAAGVWALGSALFLVQLAAAYGWDAAWSRALHRDDPRNLFWHLFAAAALPGFATIFVRAHWSAPVERRKAARLGAVLAVSAAPLLVVGLSRLAFSNVDRWMLTADSAARGAVDALVFCGLAAMPVLATLAVIVDRPFELRAFGGGWPRFPSSPRREQLAAALDRLRLAPGVRAIPAMLSRELQLGVRAARATVVPAGDLPLQSALPVMLEDTPSPIVLDRHAEPFLLLPPADRAWLDARDVSLAAAIRLRDGSLAAIVLLGPRRGGGAYDRTDRWMISTLVAVAAAMWDARDRLADTAAWECTRCGRVSGEAAACGCGGDPIPALLPRRLAGKFDVQRRLGEGGTGVVYLARDVTLGRDVALKTLPRRQGHAVSRLRDEARSMAALNHDALATIYGLEVWRGTPVLVVEHLAGGTLAGRLACRALPANEVIALGQRLADALAYMHERGLLHRDVKPSNIGFTADGAAKLLDFGLSGADGSPAGTPGYLPPETLDGAVADAAGDLWALAVVLLQASAGADERLRGFFRQALAADPADRFRSAREMLQVLSSYTS